MISFDLRGTLDYRETSYKIHLEVSSETPEAPVEVERDWRLVVPPNEWKQAIPVTRGAMEAILEMALRLGLVHRLDEEAKKLYVGGPEGLPPADPDEEPGEGILYPSGVRFPVVEPIAEEVQLYAAAEDAVAAPLVLPDLSVKVSQHFKAGEFMPKDSSYQYLRLSPALVKLVEDIRSQITGPLTINSGYRPPIYNAAVGGVPRSTHIDGLAADISAAETPVAELHEIAERLVGDRGGVGFYPYQEFVHVDLRGEKARWTS